MDDGAKDVETSIRIIRELKKQGVSKVVATPHFYSHREDIELFIKRRKVAYESLEQHWEENMPAMLFGAEVYLERGISELEHLHDLCITDSNYILLEFPYDKMKDWMIEEINNITYKFEVTPILAHIDRYLDLFEKSDYDKIFEETECIYQINNTALMSRNSLKFVLKLIKKDFPILFGSDTHDMGKYSPNFNSNIKILRAKLGERGFAELHNKIHNLVL